MVGLVTYGTHVCVHELGFTDCNKAYVFRGSKEYTAQQVNCSSKTRLKRQETFTVTRVVSHGCALQCCCNNAYDFRGSKERIS